MNREARERQKRVVASFPTCPFSSAAREIAAAASKSRSGEHTATTNSWSLAGVHTNHHHHRRQRKHTTTGIAPTLGTVLGLGD